MERFARMFPFALLYFCAITHIASGFEIAGQLAAVKVDEPTMSLLYPPLCTSKNVTPVKWTYLGLLKVRLVTSSHPKVPKLSEMVLTSNLHEIIAILEDSWYCSNRSSVKCLIEQQKRHASCCSTASNCL